MFLTATVSPSSATGTVTFYDGTIVLASAPLLNGSTNAVQTARFTVAGTRTITASYSGDAVYAASDSDGSTVRVSIGPPVFDTTFIGVLRATVGQPYQYIFQTFGGAAPLTFNYFGITDVGGGIKPLTSGQLSGTATVAGSYDFSVLVTDAQGRTDQARFNLAIAYPPTDFTGIVSSATCEGGISGWVADRNALNTSIFAAVWVDGALVASFPANIARSDSAAALGDNGLHGFSWPLPIAYKHGRATTFQVHYVSSATTDMANSVPVPGSPLTLTCGAPTASVVDAKPTAGSGVNQSFTFTFSDLGGASSFTVLNALINTALDGRKACYIAYVPSSNTVFLVDDAGNAGGPYTYVTLSGSGSAVNSQCTINGAGSSVVTSGNTLTLTLNIGFAASFGGNKVIYMSARNTAQDNTGWLPMAVFSVLPTTAASLSPVGISPSFGNTANAPVSLTYQNATGAAYIQTAWTLINGALDGRGACSLAYYRPGNQIYLIPDNGDGTQAVSMVLSGTNSVSNSQCTVMAQGSSVAVSGTQLTVNLNITFKPAFTGQKVVWMAVQNLANQTSDWQALGTWRVQ